MMGMGCGSKMIATRRRMRMEWSKLAAQYLLSMVLSFNTPVGKGQLSGIPTHPSGLLLSYPSYL